MLRVRRRLSKDMEIASSEFLCNKRTHLAVAHRAIIR